MTEQPYLARLRADIRASKLSQSEICRRAGIAQTTLIRLLQGKNSPTIRTVDAIERVLAAEKGKAA